MNLHLREIGLAVDPRAHAVLVLDGAGWHTSHIVTPPDNVTLLCLPWAVADCVTDGQDICSGTLFAHHESLMTNEAPNRFPRLVKGWALIMSLRLIPPRKRKCAVTPRYADIGVETIEATPIVVSVPTQRTKRRRPGSLPPTNTPAGPSFALAG
jgi:hypothetical protein